MRLEDGRKWKYEKDKATASMLLDLMLKNDIIPPFLQTSFGGIRSVLEATVPTARNRMSGHGQGAEPKTVPDYFAAYVLHVTASNIVLLVEADKAKPR